MLRVIKLTSPMSLGSWILTAFSAGAGVAAAAEVDRMSGDRLAARPAATGAARRRRAGRAGSRGPRARTRRVHGGPAGRHVHADLEPRARRAAVRVRQLRQPGRGRPGDDHDAGRGGGPGAQAGRARRHRRPGRDPGDAPADGSRRGRAAARGQAGRAAGAERGDSPSRAGSRPCSAAAGAAVAVAAGLSLLAASALTRFGIFEAGIRSAKDPRYTIEPQKRRLAARRAAGVTDDSITTAG